MFSQDLNEQLSSPLQESALLTFRNRGYVYSVSAGISVQFAIVSYNEETNLGVCKSERTGLSRAFRVNGTSKPVACRNYREEKIIDLFEIETLAVDGAIAAGIGEEIVGKWILPIS